MAGPTNALDARPRVHVVVARARNGVIGRDGDLPWHLPNDLKYFKALTMGAPLVMGRRTHESIGRALPGRLNVVVTSRPEAVAEGCLPAPDLERAFSLCGAVDRLFVVGGAALYAAVLPLADALHITEVDAHVEGDVTFPEFDERLWRETTVVAHAPDDRHAYPYVFRTLVRTGATVD